MSKSQIPIVGDWWADAETVYRVLLADGWHNVWSTFVVTWEDSHNTYMSTPDGFSFNECDSTDEDANPTSYVRDIEGPFASVLAVTKDKTGATS